MIKETDYRVLSEEFSVITHVPEVTESLWFNLELTSTQEESDTSTRVLCREEGLTYLFCGKPRGTLL